MILLEVKDVWMTYIQDKVKITVLKNINFLVNQREFICITGPSGCGKSTILKIITGLMPPTKGRVLFKGCDVDPANSQVSLVFQNFALLPWLTTEGNIRIALEAMKLDKKEVDKRVHKFIEVVGLGGFENAYPRELSGGMKQRVGIARALAVYPTLLCMDEPFSALDQFTAENLREELLMLWGDETLPPDAVIMVTHNIEEAVSLADRILVVSHRPGTILEDIKIDLPRPRDKKSKEFYDIVDKVYTLIT
ncbi:MAG: ABC transporter ATP-binding protein [Candidatus Thermoplasmatota archaeon]|jgi:NitT/TauT family transport system ATP-binding protein|nr:ABC transporter ATP-binding protein [Candidatus Thermoplasmatota archaeon]